MQSAEPAREERPDPQRRRVLGLVFLTLFIDLVGFSILFPLFPDLLAWYLEREGPDGFLGGLVARLEALVADRPGATFAVVALFGGLLGSVYSLLQFLFAPFWGALSDRIGRRPTLLITLSGTALSYLLWMFAGEFWLLVLARVLGGVMAGNIATASAAVADISGTRGRSAGMAIVGMAIGLGFVLGPALGAIAYHAVDATALWPGGASLGWNPFSGAAAVAFVLASWNLIWAAARFPETRPALGEAEREARRAERLLTGLSPWRALKRLRLPGVVRANMVYLAVQTAFAAMEFTLVFLAAERFGFAPKDNAWMFVFVGLVIALVQGGFVRRRAAAIGERRLMLVGVALLVPGFLAVGLANGVLVLYLGLFLLSVGSALFVPTVSALVSLYTPADQQGLSLGALRAMGSLARAVGPVLGGVIYWQLGSAAPYLVGAVFLLLPLFAATRLHQPSTAEED
jgi:MFS family permease